MPVLVPLCSPIEGRAFRIAIGRPVQNRRVGGRAASRPASKTWDTFPHCRIASRRTVRPMAVGLVEHTLTQRRIPGRPRLRHQRRLVVEWSESTDTPLSAAGDHTAPNPTRSCAWCGEEIPEGTHGRARYCGDAHRLAAKRTRETARRRPAVAAVLALPAVAVDSSGVGNGASVVQDWRAGMRRSRPPRSTRCRGSAASRQQALRRECLRTNAR
jgi:hypothetical protein